MGSVLGRFWEGFWRVLEGFWSFWDVPRPFQRCFWTLLGFVGLSWPFFALPGLFWSFPAFSHLFWFLSTFVGLERVSLLWGASEASEQSERAKLSGAFSGFPLLTLAFASVPLPSLAFCCFVSLHGIFFEWYLGIPSLILYTVSGCSLPSLVVSRFTLCRHFLKKIPLPVHLLRQVP